MGLGLNIILAGVWGEVHVEMKGHDWGWRSFFFLPGTPVTTRNNWMFQYGNEGPLHSKWLFCGHIQSFSACDWGSRSGSDVHDVNPAMTLATRLDGLSTESQPFSQSLGERKPSGLRVHF